MADNTYQAPQAEVIVSSNLLRSMSHADMSNSDNIMEDISNITTKSQTEINTFASIVEPIEQLPLLQPIPEEIIPIAPIEAPIPNPFSRPAIYTTRNIWNYISATELLNRFAKNREAFQKIFFEILNNNENNIDPNIACLLLSDNNGPDLNANGIYFKFAIGNLQPDGNYLDNGILNNIHLSLHSRNLDEPYTNQCHIKFLYNHNIYKTYNLVVNLYGLDDDDRNFRILFKYDRPPNQGDEEYNFYNDISRVFDRVNQNIGHNQLLRYVQIFKTIPLAINYIINYMIICNNTVYNERRHILRNQILTLKSTRNIRQRISSVQNRPRMGQQSAPNRPYNRPQSPTPENKLINNPYTKKQLDLLLRSGGTLYYKKYLKYKHKYLELKRKMNML